MKPSQNRINHEYFKYLALHWILSKNNKRFNISVIEWVHKTWHTQKVIDYRTVFFFMIFIATFWIPAKYYYLALLVRVGVICLVVGKEWDCYVDYKIYTCTKSARNNRLRFFIFIIIKRNCHTINLGQVLPPVCKQHQWGYWKKLKSV